MVKQKKKKYIYTYIYIVYSDSCLENCIAEQGQLEVINLYLDILRCIGGTRQNKYYLIGFTKKYILAKYICVRTVWQYGLWSFQTGGTKLEVFT